MLSHMYVSGVNIQREILVGKPSFSRMGGWRNAVRARLDPFSSIHLKHAPNLTSGSLSVQSNTNATTGAF